MSRHKSVDPDAPKFNVYDWLHYVESLMGVVGDNGNDFAAKTGLNANTLSSWRTRHPSEIPARTARAVAKAYNRPIPEAFVRAGVATPEELRVPEGGLKLGLSDATFASLLMEIQRRYEDMEKKVAELEGEPEGKVTSISRKASPRVER